MHHRIRLFLSGYVKVRVTGMEVERFFNLCQFHEIDLWGLVCENGKFYCFMEAANFHRLRDLTWKTKVRLRIVEKKGFPFLVHQRRKRIGWLAGLLTAFLLLFVCSGRMWQITFDGNLEYTDERLAKYLKRAGYQIGMPIREIICEDIEQALRIEYPNIIWVSVQKSGVKLRVWIKENEAKSIIKETEKSCDIRANHAATIVSVLTRTGTPMVKAGDQVNEKDLLVSGRIVLFDDSKNKIGEKLVAADADIIGEYTDTYHDQIPVSQNIKYETGKSKLAFEIWLGKHCWRLGKNDMTKHRQTETILRFGAFELLKHVYPEYETYEKRYFEAEARSLAEQRLNRWITKMQGADIAYHSLSLEQNGGYWHVTAVLHVVGPIGEKIVPLYE